MHKFGVSFSIKQCRNFEIDPAATLDWLLSVGFRRFRLMSYWNEYEKQQGKLDFSTLDAQIGQIASKGGVVTLCLGARQPRWPENHWPDWAWQLSKTERTRALLDYIRAVVVRYQNYTSIISWQLENEALLAEFGERSEVDRDRLRREFSLVKDLDPDRPVIMTTSTSWGIPFRQPIPDIVGFSFYQIVHNKGKYSKSFHKPWVDRLRAGIVQLLWRRPSFIHELQCEPWGPKNIWEMTPEEQAASMSLEQININLELAKKTNLYPIDLWGGEWWYWRYLQGDENVWQAVKQAVSLKQHCPDHHGRAHADVIGQRVVTGQRESINPVRWPEVAQERWRADGRLGCSADGRLW